VCAVQVYNTADVRSGPSEDGANFAFDYESDVVEFTIPITSLDASGDHVGASFVQYTTPALFDAGLDASDQQIGSVVVAAQVACLGWGPLRGHALFFCRPCMVWPLSQH
jgi:hypothetical protein